MGKVLIVVLRRTKNRRIMTIKLPLMSEITITYWLLICLAARAASRAKLTANKCLLSRPRGVVNLTLNRRNHVTLVSLTGDSRTMVIF